MRTYCLIFAMAGALVLLPLKSRADDGAPTYATVAPILYANCAECHRPGDIAPMSLTSYEDVRPWAKAIRSEVAARRMPPWHADDHIGVFSNDSGLSEEEIAMIVRWVDAGAPLGDPSAVPAPPVFDTAWKSGEPDMVLTMPVAFEMPAEGDDIYRCFVMDPIEEDVWLKGTEFRPGNRSINHHVVLFLDGTGRMAPRLDARTPEPGYPCFGSSGFPPTDVLGLWAPGMQPDMLPEGIGRPLPKGSRLVIQTHYHSSGVAESDQSSVGLYFARGPIQKRMRIGVPMDWDINIQPGERDYVSTGTWTLPTAARIYGIFPHMHLIGKASQVNAIKPGGERVPLLSVSRYDFDWQRVYQLADPIDFPGGTTFEIVSRYDNSAENPNNPNSPPEPVTFGFASDDEMNVAFVYLTYDQEDLSHVPLEKSARGMAIMGNPPPPTVRLNEMSAGGR